MQRPWWVRMQGVFFFYSQNKIKCITQAETNIISLQQHLITRSIDITHAKKGVYVVCETKTYIETHIYHIVEFKMCAFYWGTKLGTRQSGGLVVCRLASHHIVIISNISCFENNYFFKFTHSNYTETAHIHDLIDECDAKKWFVLLLTNYSYMYSFWYYIFEIK